MTQIVVILGIFLIQYAGASDPCNSSTLLPYMTERVSGYKLLPGATPICDYYLTDGWYSMDNFTLANTTTGCGTSYTWYMKGKLPTKGEADITVCKYEGPGNVCSSTKSVKAKKCHGGTYVFYLVSVDGCSEAYCIRSLSSASAAGGKAPDVSKMPKPKVEAEVQIIQRKHGIKDKNQLIFFCDVSPLPLNNLYYVVEWSLTTGLSVTSLIHQSADTKYVGKTDFRIKTALTEKHLHDFGFRTLGFSLVCAVKVKNGPAGKFSNARVSDSKFCGVQVRNKDVVTLKDKDVIELPLRLTVPFGCPMNTNSCQLVFSMYIPSPTSCSLSQVALKTSRKNTCAVTFQSTDVDKDKKFKVTAAIGRNLDERTRIFAVQLISIPFTAHPIFQNYSVDPIRVQLVTNTKLLSGKKCYAHSDPHMLTFDGLPYENQNNGIFTLYRNAKNRVEVQIKTEKCPNYNPRTNKPWCTCAVAVRAGRDIFTIDNCGKSSIANAKFRKCEDRVLQRKVKRDSTGRTFHVYLPTGTEVKLDHTWHNLIEVDIIPSVVDRNNTDGLCGSFDQDNSNDRAHRPGSKEHDPNRSWMVPAGENLLDKNNYHKLDRWEEDIYICTCVSSGSGVGQFYTPQATCDTTKSKLIQCKNNNLKDVDHAMCSLTGRKRRDTTSDMYELDTHEEVETDFYSNHAGVVDSDSISDGAYEIHKRSVYTNGTARQDCLAQMNTTSFRMCSSLPNLNVDDYIDNCVADALMSGSMEWTLIHLEGLKKQCLHNVEVNQPIPEDVLHELDTLTEEANITNTTSSANGTAPVPVIPTAPNFNFTTELLDDIKNVSCPRECSGKGLCIKGKCVCNTSFIGTDCAIDASKPPEMIGIPDKGKCDLQNRKCGKTSVFGRHFVDEPSLACRLNPFKVDQKGMLIHDLPRDIAASMETFTEIKCELPFQRTRRSPSVRLDDFVARGYKVSVSNDRKGFSAEDIIIIFDSMCVNCSKIAGKVFCNVKPGFCMDMGRCYKFGESSGCYSCIGDKPESLVWTAGPDCPVHVPDQGPPRKLWIIGATLGPFLAVIIIALVAAYCLKRKGLRIKEMNTTRNPIYKDES